MRPRLRSTVTYLSTADGMLFRHGDRFLPIKGANAWESYQRIKPLLEAGILSEEERAGLLDSSRQVLEHFCQGLKAAGMLYDSDEDNRELVSVAVQERYAAQLAKVEVGSDCPVRVFANVRAKQLLVAGPADLALTVIEAALESGMRNVSLLCPDRTAETQESLHTIAHRFDTDADIPLKISLHRSPEQILVSCDSLIVVGRAGGDWQRLNEWLEPLLDSGQCSAFALCLGRNRVVASEVNLPGRGGCSLCIGSYCSDGLPAQMRACDVTTPAAISIGARLAVQHLWDVATDRLAEEVKLTMLQLDLRTFAVQRLPRPAGFQCSQCNGPQCVLEPEGWLAGAMGREGLDAIELCKGAEKVCVNANTGVMVTLDEVGLLQYPYHQCAALLRNGPLVSSTAWLTECGEDMVEARAGVIRRAMEAASANQIKRQYPSAIPGPCYSSSGKVRGGALPPALGAGVLVSGVSWDELTNEGFFRALAALAQLRGEWAQLDCCGMIPANVEVSLLAAHLRDVGVLQFVTVSQFVTNMECCSVLRFEYQGKPISIVAGRKAETLWEIGLQDIWMHVSACDALPGYKGPAPGDVRLRAAGGPFDGNAAIAGIQSLEAASGLTLCLVPVGIPGVTTPFPLSFAHASLRSAVSEVAPAQSLASA